MVMPWCKGRIWPYRVEQNIQPGESAMCIHNRTQNPRAERLRRKAVVAAACSAAMAAVPALSSSHAHPVLGATAIAIQFCLVTLSLGLLIRMRRLGRSEPD